MTTPKYYTNNNDLINDNALAATFFGMFEEFVVQALNEPTNNLTRTVKFLGKNNTFSQLATETYDVVVKGDDNSVTIGSAYIDMAANAAGTKLLTAILGLTSLNALAIGLVATGVTAIAYSALLEPFVDDFFLTLAGKDMIQFFDEEGEEVAGLIFPDGFPGNANDAIHAFVSHPDSARLNLDFTKGHLQVDDDLWIDDEYQFKYGQLFEDIADGLGLTLAEFLSLSSGEYSNDEFYAVNEDGQAFVFYNTDGEQKLAIPYTLNGHAVVDNVDYVQVDNIDGGSEGSNIWGNESDDIGLFINKTGAYMKGSFGDDWVFGKGDNQIDLTTLNLTTLITNFTGTAGEVV